MRRWLAAGISGLFACDTGTIAEPPLPTAALFAQDFASGSRLRAVVWDVDGVQVLRHFMDTTRNEECAFIEEGKAHVGQGPTYWCLPLGAATHDANGALAFFADRDCTVPVALAPERGGSPYVIARPIDACGGRPSVYQAAPTTQTRPYALDGTRCVRAAAPIATQALGEPIPLDAFVQAIEQLVPTVGGRIAALVALGADGARQTIGGFDRERNAAVTVTDPGGAKDPRWFPARLAFDGAGTALYSDDSCKATLQTKIARDALCPLSAGFTFSGQCGAGLFYELGAPIEQTALRERDAAGKCVATATSGVLAYARGVVIERNRFAAAYVVERGGNRVRVRAWSDGTTVPMLTDLIDVGTSEACTPNAAFDGSMRCLPSASGVSGLFADNECTIPGYESATDDCGARPTPGYIRIDGHAFQVTGPASMLWEFTEKGCAPHPPTSSTHAFSLLEVEIKRFARVAARQL